jgi:hypothetical protein
VSAVRPALTLYSRSYCHLCDDMIAALRQLQGRFVFEIKVVDVDSDAALEARYGELVPVLTGGVEDGVNGAERELCHYFLDVPAVTAFLTEIR